MARAFRPEGARPRRLLAGDAGGAPGARLRPVRRGLRRPSRAAAAAFLALVACAAPPTTARTPAPARPARGVVLISIDTLRADHVGAIRAGVALTPSIDGLAREAVRFTD